MPAGIEVYNDSGTLQITESYVGYALRYKGSIALSAASVGYEGSITLAAVSPLMAFAKAQDTSLYNVADNGDGTWTFHFNSAVSGTVNYYLFDKASNVTISETFGVEVFRADGSRAFHSSMKPLRVVAVIDQTPPADGPPAADSIYNTVSIPAGKTYALLCGSFCFRVETELSEVDYGPLPVGQHWYENYTRWSGGKVGATQVGAGLILYQNYQSAQSGDPTQYITRGDLMFWVIDVTNF